MERPARSLVITERFILLDQHTIAYTLRRNRRAKRITLRVDQSGLTMTVPWTFPTDQLEPFIRERKDWVLANLDRLAGAGEATQEPVWTPADGVQLLGRERSVRFGSPSQKGVTLSGETIILPARLSGDHEQAHIYLTNWLKQFARTYLVERLHQHGLTMGVAPTRVTLRSQKTRWGSCSSQGAISLNWRLIMAPPAVIDYILTHELAHLIELNHSDRFWAIVAHHDPRYRDHRLWLRANGASLVF